MTQPKAPRSIDVTPSPCRRITGPDGTAWTIALDRLPTGQATWVVRVARDGVEVAAFNLQRMDATVWGAGRHATPVALWNIDVDDVEQPPHSTASPTVPILLVALALIRRDADGTARRGSLARIRTQQGMGTKTALLAMNALESLTGSGLPFGVTCDADYVDVLLPALPDVDLEHVAAALTGGPPLSIAMEFPPAEGLMAKLDRAGQSSSRHENKLWAVHMLRWVAAEGGLDYRRAAAWGARVDTSPLHHIAIRDAQSVLVNTPAQEDTDPVPHLERLVKDRDMVGLVWWMRRSPLPVWHRAMAWAVTQEQDLLDAVLVVAVRCGVIPTLPADTLAAAMHRASGAMRTDVLAAIGDPASRGTPQPSASEGAPSRAVTRRSGARGPSAPRPGKTPQPRTRRPG